MQLIEWFIIHFRVEDASKVEEEAHEEAKEEEEEDEVSDHVGPDIRQCSIMGYVIDCESCIGINEIYLFFGFIRQYSIGYPAPSSNQNWDIRFIPILSIGTLNSVAPNQEVFMTISFRRN